MPTPERQRRIRDIQRQRISHRREWKHQRDTGRGLTGYQAMRGAKVDPRYVDPVYHRRGLDDAYRQGFRRGRDEQYRYERERDTTTQRDPSSPGLSPVATAATGAAIATGMSLAAQEALAHEVDPDTDAQLDANTEAHAADDSVLSAYSVMQPVTAAEQEEYLLGVDDGAEVGHEAAQAGLDAGADVGTDSGLDM